MIRQLVDKVLVLLKIKKSFVWKPSNYEIEKLKHATKKIFRPTVNCIQQITQGGNFKISLSYTDLEGKKQVENFPIKIISDSLSGLKFKIRLPNILTIGSVLYKESYGLSEDLKISNKKYEYFIPKDSVQDFKTIFPSKPQILEGRFSSLKTSKEQPDNTYFRLLIPMSNERVLFPTSIL